MSDEKQTKSEAYAKARKAFDELHIEERASFLVESVVAMMAEGVGKAGKVVSEMLDDLGESLDRCCEDESDADSEEGAPGKPSGSRKTASKRSTKASTSRKSTSRRSKAGPKDTEGDSDTKKGSS